MHFLKNFYGKTLKYNLINKFFYKKERKIPKLKKIVLSFKTETTKAEQLSSNLLAIELLTNQKGTFIKAKKPNILTKLRENDPIGCKVTLWNRNLFEFLDKSITETFLETKAFTKFKLDKKIWEKSYSYKFDDTFSFSELKSHYYFFQNLSILNSTIVITSQNKKELIFILKSLQLPFKY